MREPLFNHLRPLILASKSINKSCFFQSRFLDLLFFHFVYIFFKNGRLWNSLRNPMGSKMVPQIDQCAPKVAKNLIPWRHLNKLAPETPPEAPQVIFFMMFKGFGSFPDLMLKVFQWFLASLLILNSGIRPNRQTPETMQYSSRDRARNF